MVKVQKNSNRITPFAGISLLTMNLPAVYLENSLTVNRVREFRDAIISTAIFFARGLISFFVEDIARHLRPTLENIPENKVPSPDTLLLMLDEPATDNTTVVSSSGQAYQFNINKKLNDLVTAQAG
jgi:hypothetical protein